MNYIVFDLEWNIAGKANRVDRETLRAIPFEIIEIGAVKLDSQFRHISQFSTQIRPKIYPQLSGPVAAVTRRYQQSLRYGLAFPDAAREFLAWCGSDIMFATWSESDSDVLRMNLRYYQGDDRLPARCLDVQQVFDLLIEQEDVQRSIEYAVDFLRLAKDKPFHQAVHDAAYTGKILCRIAEIMASEQPSLDWIGRLSYDPNQTRTSQLTLPGLAGSADARASLDARAFVCPACGETLTISAGWTERGSSLRAAFSCPEHGRVEGKCRLRGDPGVQTTAYVTIRICRSLED